MQHIGIKHIVLVCNIKKTAMEGGMFCYIHVGGKLVKYIGGWIIYIEINEPMSHDEFRSRVCVRLNMQLDLVKIEFTVKIDLSFFILLCDDVSFASMFCRNDIYCRVYVSSSGHKDCDFPVTLK